ncbi:MAG: RsbRD N-terminal domain-containing protein [Candidatus Kapabacteria bacterium]|nr:RsbRD N-terminal domain-containing protein [Candidatus Kapabacteria bacterium]
MDINKSLENSKELILNEWINSVFDSYPIESGKFLKNGKNRFSNPVGYNLAKELENLLDLIFVNQVNDKEKIRQSLESFLKIRVVQDFEPSVTINFFLNLKKIIYSKLDSQVYQANDLNKLLSLFEQIDSIALEAVDIFVLLKSKIFEIKANELKNRFGKMADRIMKKYGIDENNDNETKFNEV